MDEMSVMIRTMRVHGLDGIRVVDASVYPTSQAEHLHRDDGRREGG